jgi:hypothetical protein
MNKEILFLFDKMDKHYFAMLITDMIFKKINVFDRENFSYEIVDQVLGEVFFEYDISFLED